MAFTYSDYITETDLSTKLTKARAFAKELFDMKDEWQSLSGAGMSGSRFPLDRTIDTVLATIAELEKVLGVGTSSRRAPFVKGKPLAPGVTNNGTG